MTNLSRGSPGGALGSDLFIDIGVLPKGTSYIVPVKREKGKNSSFVKTGS